MNDREHPVGEIEQPVTAISGLGTNRWRDKPGWKIFTALLTCAALVGVLLVFAAAWPELVKHRSSIDFKLLGVGLALALIAAYLTFVPFAVIARENAGFNLTPRQLAHLYFTAQLLKHLPGRIWGIGYQLVAGKQGNSTGTWLSVNILHMALATFFGMASSAIVLALNADWRMGVLTLAVALACYQMIWSSVFLIRWSAGKIKFLHRLQGILFSIENVSASTRLRLLLIFTSSWLVYYLSWYFFGLAYPSVGGPGGLQMCALYFLAWFVGYLSLLTPSGLGVRELVFAWLARDFPPDAVAMMAIVGRVNLLSVDVILGLMFSGSSLGRKDPQ